jgi:hypothetical protein
MTAALVLVACVLIGAAVTGCLILRDDTGEHAAPRARRAGLDALNAAAAAAFRARDPQLLKDFRDNRLRAALPRHPKTRPASDAAEPEAGPATLCSPGPAGTVPVHPRAGTVPPSWPRGEHPYPGDGPWALAPVLYATGEQPRLGEHTEGWWLS